jgi:hypothetical protein
MLLFPTLGGIVPLWWGAVGLWGHRELEIRGQWLRTIERLGPFWRSKRWRLTKISRFAVVAAVPPYGEQPTPVLFERFNALLARLDGGKQGMLAWGYDDQMLRQLGVALAERGNKVLERDGHEYRIGAPSSRPAELSSAENGDRTQPDWEDDDEDIEEDLPPLRPADSKVEFERFEGGLSIKVPAAGLWAGTGGLFFFSLLWNGFMAVFTTLGVLALVKGKADGDLWIVGLFCGAFWLIGIGLLLGSLSMARRRAGIAVADGELMILQTGLFRSQQREWAPGEVAAVRCGPSGISVNKRPVLELQIYGTDGQKFGILAGRSERELEWLAWELRQSLGAPEFEGDDEAD